MARKLRALVEAKGVGSLYLGGRLAWIEGSGSRGEPNRGWFHQSAPFYPDDLSSHTILHSANSPNHHGLWKILHLPLALDSFLPSDPSLHLDERCLQSM